MRFSPLFHLLWRSARNACRLRVAKFPALGCIVCQSTFTMGDDRPPLVVIQAIQLSSSYTVFISIAQSPPADWRTCAFTGVLLSLLLVSLTVKPVDNGRLRLARCLAVGTFPFYPRRIIATCGRTQHSSRPKGSTWSVYPT